MVVPLIIEALSVDVVSGVTAIVACHRTATELRLAVFADRETRKAFFRTETPPPLPGLLV